MSPECPLRYCGKPLFIIRSYAIPLSGNEMYDPNDIGDAVSFSWHVECEEGHKVLDGADGNDYARPFSQNDLDKIVGSSEQGTG